MNRNIARSDFVGIGVPRTRGDEPEGEKEREKGGERSPHPRG